MMIYIPQRRPQAAGFWAFDDHSQRLIHVDAHEESTVHTRWPVLDRWHQHLIESGVDWLLNAAGAGRERLDAALRAAYPGSRLDGLPPVQSMFWHRLVHGLSGGAQASLYLGDGAAGSSGGLVVDDASDGTTIDGWRWTGNAYVDKGTGPGGGITGYRSSGHGRPGSGGGSYGTQGAHGQNAGNSRGGDPGELVSASLVFEGLRTNTFTKEVLGLGGSGHIYRNVYGSNLRESTGGDGYLRMSVESITEDTSRSLSGGTSNDIEASGGSGGLYLAACGRSWSSQPSVTLQAPGGAGSDVGNDGGDGGNGRVIICYGDAADTSAGTITDAVLTTYQLLPAVPFGGLLVS